MVVRKTNMCSDGLFAQHCDGVGHCGCIAKATTHIQMDCLYDAVMVDCCGGVEMGDVCVGEKQQHAFVCIVCVNLRWSIVVVACRWVVL